MPTNGNAGAAWAAYAARAGMRATIAMPADAPEICRRECVAAGAALHVVDGLITDAGRLIAGIVAGGDVFDAGTLREPYRLEGKKTMGYELVEQLGWRTPDVILYPTGGGVGLIGIHKALGELRALRWIDPAAPPPRLVAVQSTGCAPIVRAYEAGARTATPWPDARTVAFGITVPAPLGDALILDALAATGGTAIAVDDADLLADLRAFAVHEGLWLCPEGAACLTAARLLRDSGWIAPGEEVLVLNTGTGLKYPGTVPASAAGAASADR
jgi:threonine synthase